MSDTETPSETIDGSDTAQYLYCLVAASDDESLEVSGIEDAPVSVVTTNGVGVVTSPTSERVETDSELAVKRLLVAHQRVVDAAMDRYGTPLPVQATTAVDGDESAVRAWLADRSPTVREELGRLAGDREYHITVSWADDAAHAAAHHADDRLDELERTIEAADPGESYLREKQYEQLLDEVVAELEADLAAETRTCVASVARTVVERASQSAVSFATADTTAVVRLAALTALEDEDALGEALDTLTDRTGVTIRFTGPWAPYSFVPDLENGGDE